MNKGGTSRPFLSRDAHPAACSISWAPSFSLFSPSRAIGIKLASRITRFHKHITTKFITLPAILSIQGVLLLYGNIDPVGIDFA
jgi:hypothetical protein